MAVQLGQTRRRRHRGVVVHHQRGLAPGEGSLRRAEIQQPDCLRGVWDLWKAPPVAADADACQAAPKSEGTGAESIGVEVANAPVRAGVELFPAAQLDAQWSTLVNVNTPGPPPVSLTFQSESARVLKNSVLPNRSAAIPEAPSATSAGSRAHHSVH